MSITVVGASLAGLSTVRALRAQGYDGELVVVGEERHTPYDRPPLSKDFLTGDIDADALALGDADEYEALQVTWLLGHLHHPQDPGRPAGACDRGQGGVLHLILVDLRESELDGQQAEDRLREVGITVDRNAVPDDPRPPMVTSGLRIGTPALATRGFTAEDFTEVADVIAEALKPSYDTEALKARVKALADKHPLYPGLNK